MRLYIAGKITGDPDYKEKFAAAQAKLEAQGHTVLSPARLPIGMTCAEYMRICFAMMECADAVVFLEGYEESDGALLEWGWCRYTGKELLLIKEEPIKGMEETLNATHLPKQI